MKVIKTYPTQVDADIDRLALEAEGIPAVVLGIGAAMEGGNDAEQPSGATVWRLRGSPS